MKYTKELLEPVVRESTSYGQIIDKLGMKRGGGTQANIVRRVRKFELDTSHFLGQGWNRGKPRPKLHFTEVLVNCRTGRREHADLLRRVLIEAGVKEQCECGQGTVWQGKWLVLQIDHKDGDFLNNEIQNLRFLCSNCHSQTGTFGTRNRKDLSMPVQIKHMLKDAGIMGPNFVSHAVVVERQTQ